MRTEQEVLDQIMAYAAAVPGIRAEKFGKRVDQRHISGAFG